MLMILPPPWATMALPAAWQRIRAALNWIFEDAVPVGPRGS